MSRADRLADSNRDRWPYGRAGEPGTRIGSAGGSSAFAFLVPSQSDVEPSAIHEALSARKRRRPSGAEKVVDASPALDAGGLAALSRSGVWAMDYLNPMTMLSGPDSGSTRERLNPASFIHFRQSAPVKSNPPCVSMSMFRLMSRPKAFRFRASSISAS